MAGTPDIAFFQAEQSERLFADRLKGAENERLAEVLTTVTSHLHAIIRETKPSLTDWRTAINFLTEVGHLTDERRQEWVLVSDLLGTSSLVDALNSDRPVDATPNTMRGPFYRPDVALMPQGSSISLDGVGAPVEVTLRILNLKGLPVPGARVETWQANAQGFYENQQPDLQPEHNLRGHFQAGQDGTVSYRTVRPSGYEVPKDGPLGDLLLRLGAPLCRPAHIYYQVSAPGFETLTTQIFDADDPNLGKDPLFSVKPGLVGTFLCDPGNKDAAFNLDLELILNPLTQEPRT